MGKLYIVSGHTRTRVHAMPNKILICLQQNRIDVDQAAQADKLNECVSSANRVAS